MKTLTFTVKIEFSDNIDKKAEIDIVAANVLDALIYQADSAGLAPAALNDAYTKKVTVKHINGLTIQQTL